MTLGSRCISEASKQKANERLLLERGSVLGQSVESSAADGFAASR
jgi:hypothetical protein